MRKDSTMPLIVRDLNNMFAQISGMPINSRGGQNMLKKAGIDTNSAQYKRAMSDIYASMGGIAGFAYTDPQSIKNLMQSYDSDGNELDAYGGLAGLVVNEKGASVRNRIISIPESSKDEMFELTKKEFLKYNGSSKYETGRTDVYYNMYRKLDKKDRLPAGYTLQVHEDAYLKKMISIAKDADPNWQAGFRLSDEARNAIKNLTREDVEKNLNL